MAPFASIFRWVGPVAETERVNFKVEVVPILVQEESIKPVCPPSPTGR